LISKKDLIERMKAKENADQNPYNLTQKQLDELEVTKAQVAEHLKNVDFSRIDNPTEAERQAEKVYRFTHILGNRKSRNEY
jgi:hypothetical protein